MRYGAIEHRLDWMDGKEKKKQRLYPYQGGAKGNCKFIPEHTEQGDPWAIFGVICRRKDDYYVPDRGGHFRGRRGHKKAKFSRTVYEFFLI